MTDTVKGWLLVVTTILGVSLQAIIGFSDLAKVEPVLRVVYLAVCALLLAGALLYWASTARRTPLETTAILALLAIASTATICVSMTYHNLTTDTRLENGRLAYVLHGANTAVDVEVVATTNAGSVEPLFYHLDTGSQLALPEQDYYELDDRVVVKGFKRPYVLTVWYPGRVGAEIPEIQPQGRAGTLLSMARIRELRRQIVISGVLLWILLSLVAFWLSSRWRPSKPSAGFGFRPQPTATGGSSSTP